MPNITLTLGTASYTHTVSAADTTRIINALSSERGVAATASALCPVLAKEFFGSLKHQTQTIERRVAVADIPATES